MNKVLGIAGLLIAVVVVTAVFSPSFLTAYNLQNIIRWTALFGIISIGAAFVIITGGIDLSVGSIVGLVGCLMPLLFISYGWPLWLMVTAVLAVAVVIGFAHGLLITKLRLQPFVVTLCGLLIFRGVARWITEDKTLGFGSSLDDSLRLFAVGKPFSVSCLLVIVGVVIVCICAAILIRAVARGSDTSKMTNNTRSSLLHLVWGAAVGLLLVVIGSSRFWSGWEVDSAESWLTGRRLIFPAGAVDVPAAVSWWSGLVMLAPAVIILGVGAIWRAGRRIAIPVACLLVGIALAVSSVHAINDGDGFIALLPASMQYGLFSTGALGCVFGWMEFARRIWILDISWLRAALCGVMLGGLLWLIGMTPILAVLIPMPFLILLVIAVASGVFLNHTHWGRHLLALGNNEIAARYSGINTEGLTILAYVICAFLAGVAGVLFAVDVNVIQPASHGNFYELYAIAAAVLGGCSLRGGEGSILGVVIGAAVMRVLYNSINLLGIPTQLEFAIIGGVILVGVVIDEVVRRIVARRRTSVLESVTIETGTPPVDDV